MHYCTSRLGQRLFTLEMGLIGLAFCGHSDPDSLRRIDDVWAKDPALFAQRWFEECGLPDAAGLLDTLSQEEQDYAYCP